MHIDLRKIYLFVPVEPVPDPASLPKGGDIFYECTSCATVVTSVPHIKSACKCGNLSGGAGKLTVLKPEEVRVMRGKLK